MKNFLLSLFAVFMATASWAVDFSVGDLTYSTYSSNYTGFTVATVTGLTNTARGKSNLSLVIPSTVTNSGTTYRVAQISENAFLNAANITEVEMKYGVFEIASNAFQGCTALSTVRMPSSMRSILNNAFSGCTALKYVYYAGFDYPEGTVQSTAFPANSGMYLYISPLSARSESDYKSRTGFTRFATVAKNKHARDHYMNDGGLYTVGYPDKNNAAAVREVTCVGFEPNGSNTSNGTVYKPYNSYTNTGMTFNVTTIGENALKGQTGIKTIDFSASTYLTTFKSGAFQDCSGVTSFTLPKTNFDFYSTTFMGLSSLTAFSLASGSTSYSIHDGSLYNYSKTKLWRVPGGKTGGMTYPATLTDVWNWAHSNCTKITSCRLPYGVKTIGAGAFYGTTSLDYTYIPSSVKSLSNDRVLSGTKSNNYIYCNMATPPTVTASNYFGTTSSMRLFVPYGKEDTYKNAGWTGFNAYNSNGIQAHDIYTNNLAYTVTSNASTTVNGTSYGGRVKLACYGHAGNDNNTEITVPASVTYNGKTYAVTMIGEDAFNNHTSNFTVAGCANIDTIGESAFREQPVTSYAFTHNLTTIGNYAFFNSGLTGTVALPYGIKRLGMSIFSGCKFTRIVLPSSLYTLYGNILTNCTALTEIVLNLSEKSFWSYSGWNLTGVPNTCKILVPTGVVKQYQQNSQLSSRSSYITAGAYDFAYSNGYTGSYFLTIISNSSTTYSGTTYAGKAKYVYHPNIQAFTGSGNYVFETSEEDRTVSSDVRKYLITELGDSLLYGSKYTGGTIPASVTRIGQSAFRESAFKVNNMVLPSGLTFIGHDAFYNSKITGEVKIPTSVTTLEEYALCASTLGAIYFPDMALPTMGQRVWSQSGEVVVWVPNTRASQYLTLANGWGVNYGSKLAVWIKPYAQSQPFSSVLPTNLAGSNVNAYYASGYDKSNTGKEVTLTKANQAPENTGLLLDGLTVGQEYRIKRPTSSVSAPMTNYLMPAINATNVYSQTVGYYWSNDTKKFVKPTSSYNTLAGSAYLKLSSTEASGKTEVYTNLWPKQQGGIKGDIDGNGIVEIADVNALINIMLGNKQASDYPGNANVNGVGGIDIADVNALISIMLGN